MEASLEAFGQPGIIIFLPFTVAQDCLLLYKQAYLGIDQLHHIKPALGNLVRQGPMQQAQFVELFSGGRFRLIEPNARFFVTNQFSLNTQYLTPIRFWSISACSLLTNKFVRFLLTFQNYSA